jgi:hypothetical protein
MLPIRFNLSGVTSVRSVADIRVNNKDEYRNLVYIGKPLPHQIPISFIGMPEPTSLSIKIIDSNESPTALEMIENSHLIRFRQVQTAKIFDLPVRSADITDVTNTDTRGEPIPLFWRHEITDGLANVPSVVDQELRPVSGDRFKLLVEGGNINVFHNLRPKVNFENLRTEAFYIRYTNTSGEQIFSLLDSQRAYSKANILDGLDPLKRTYSVRERGTTYQFRILYQGGGPFYVQIDEADQLKLTRPLFVRGNESWNLEVTDGELFAGDGIAAAERFHIPEYHFQSFSPVEPIKYSGSLEGLILSEHLVKLPFENVVLDDNNKIDILVTDKSFNPKYGFTTGSTSPTPYWVDRFSRQRAEAVIVRFPLVSFTGRGASVQKAFGLVHIPTVLDPEDKVFIRARYEEKRYKYRGLNLNPLHNRNLKSGRAVVYCIPNSEVNQELRSLYHFILDEDNSIIDWNDDRLGAGGVLDGALVPGPGQTGLGLFKTVHPTFLILGTVSISRNTSAEQLTYIDIRERGGVLTDDVKRNISAYLEEFPELQWVDDESLHGRGIPAHGAVVVDLPFSVLERAGGNFSEEEVHGAVTRHAALGTAPIIRYYADKPELVSMVYDTVAATLAITWTTVSHADSYRIYVAERAEGPYLSLDVTDATAGAVDNSLTKTITLSAAGDITIEPSDELYIYIAPLKDAVEWPEGDPGFIDLLGQGGAEINPLNANLVSPPTEMNPLNANIVA